MSGVEPRVAARQVRARSPMADPGPSGLDGAVELRLKRVYEEASDADGFRVLVDRLWPRGVSKERARLDLWAKEVAPSAELRTAFHRDGLAWDDFAAAYRAELAGPTRAALDALRDEIAGHDVVTLLHAVSDETHNHALILREALEQRGAKG